MTIRWTPPSIDLRHEPPSRRAGGTSTAVARQDLQLSPQRALLFLLAIGALLLAFAGPAAATSEEEAPPAEETTAPANVPAPAVSIPDEAPAAPAPEWTFRFLVPATLLIGGLAVVGTIVAYFAKVTRQRYRVVE